jgi:hypothetical protein
MDIIARRNRPMTLNLPHSPNSQRIPDPLNNALGLASFNLIHPPRNGHRVRNQLGRLQKLDIILHGLLQLWEGQEVQASRLEFRCGAGTVISSEPNISLVTVGRDNSPKVLLDNTVRILILERQHAASGVLDEHNLGGGEELLADDDGADGVDGGAASLFMLVFNSHSLYGEDSRCE